MKLLRVEKCETCMCCWDWGDYKECDHMDWPRPRRIPRTQKGKLVDIPSWCPLENAPCSFR